MLSKLGWVLLALTTRYLGPLHYEPSNQAGSVTGCGLLTIIKSKQQNQNGGIQTCIVRGCGSFVDPCNFTYKADLLAFEVKIHT